MGAAVGKGVAKAVIKGTGKSVAKFSASIIGGAFKSVVRTSVEAVYLAKEGIEDKIIRVSCQIKVAVPIERLMSFVI